MEEVDEIGLDAGCEDHGIWPDLFNAKEKLGRWLETVGLDAGTWLGGAGSYRGSREDEAEEAGEQGIFG